MSSNNTKRSHGSMPAFTMPKTSQSGWELVRNGIISAVGVLGGGTLLAWILQQV